MTIEKKDRNKDIFNKHRSYGKTYSELADEYGISSARVRQICQKERAYMLSKPFPILEIKQSCEDFNATYAMYFRIINALHRERIDVNGKWQKLSREEILSMKGIGEQAADILVHAQQIAKQER